jgi:VanZ family protein
VLYYVALHHLATQPAAAPVDSYGLDKVAHAAAFAVLGALLVRARPGAGWRQIGAFLLLGAGLGLFDEWSPRSIPGRSASVLDWVADVIGVSIGLRFGEYIWRLPEFRWFRASAEIARKPDGSRRVP